MVGLVVKPWQNVSVYGNYIQGLQEGADRADRHDQCGRNLSRRR